MTGPEEWWYLTFLVGGEVSLTDRSDRWGGRMLITHRRPDGRHDRYTADVPSSRVEFDTAGAALRLGESSVRQRDGKYQLRAMALAGGRQVSLDLTVRAATGLASSYLRIHDRVGVVTIGGWTRWLTPDSSVRQLHRIAELVMDVRGDDMTVPSDLTHVPRAVLKGASCMGWYTGQATAIATLNAPKAPRTNAAFRP